MLYFVIKRVRKFEQFKNKIDYDLMQTKIFVGIAITEEIKMLFKAVKKQTKFLYPTKITIILTIQHFYLTVLSKKVFQITIGLNQ